MNVQHGGFKFFFYVPGPFLLKNNLNFLDAFRSNLLSTISFVNSTRIKFYGCFLVLGRQCAFLNFHNVRGYER